MLRPPEEDALAHKRRQKRPLAGPRRDEGWPLATIKEEGAKPPPLAVVEGTIERMVPGGFGLLRDDEGVVLSRGGVVGERVRVEVESRKGGVRQGQVVHVSLRSTERVTPDCDAHPRCGGCDLLDLSERAQGDAKEQIVRDALQRIGRVGDEPLSRVRPIERAPRFAGARRRARLHVNEAGEIGFHARGSHELVPLDACPALAPALEHALEDLADVEFLVPDTALQLACDDDGRVSLAVTSFPSRREAERFAGRVVESGIATGSLVLSRSGTPTARYGDPTLHGEVAPGCEGGPYLSDASTFTQATRFGGATISRLVLEGSAGGERVLELFAGAGHLTLPLAARGARVVAVEGDARAYDWLARNVDLAPFGARIEAHRARVGEHTLDALLAGSGPFDTLVADPPRTGIDGFSSLLEVMRPPRVVLVSCDPATGARDLRAAFVHGYTLRWLAPIDAFPRTSHVEWVARLELE